MLSNVGPIMRRTWNAVAVEIVSGKLSTHLWVLRIINKILTLTVDNVTATHAKMARKSSAASFANVTTSPAIVIIRFFVPDLTMVFANVAFANVTKAGLATLVNAAARLTHAKHQMERFARVMERVAVENASAKLRMTLGIQENIARSVPRALVDVTS